MKAGRETLRLVPKAALFHDSSGWGIRCADQTQRAKNSVQTALLQALERGSTTLDELVRAAAAAQPDTPGTAPLALAEFILDFESYFEDKT